MKEFKLILSTLKRVKSEQEGRKGRRKEIGEKAAFNTNSLLCIS